MRAIVGKAFDGVPDGEVYPKAFAPGDVILGDLAAVAVRDGLATEEVAESAPDLDPSPAGKPVRTAKLPAAA